MRVQIVTPLQCLSSAISLPKLWNTSCNSWPRAQLHPEMRATCSILCGTSRPFVAVARQELFGMSSSSTTTLSHLGLPMDRAEQCSPCRAPHTTVVISYRKGTFAAPVMVRPGSATVPHPAGLIPQLAQHSLPAEHVRKALLEGYWTMWNALVAGAPSLCFCPATKNCRRYPTKALQTSLSNFRRKTCAMVALGIHTGPKSAGRLRNVSNGLSAQRKL